MAGIPALDCPATAGLVLTRMRKPAGGALPEMPSQETTGSGSVKRVGWSVSKHPRPAAPTSTDHPFRAAVFKNLWPLAQARGWDAFEAFYLAVGVAILALGIDPALFGLRARCRRGHGLARLYDYQNRHGTAFVQCRPCMRINRRARRHRKRASSSAEHHRQSVGADAQAQRLLLRSVWRTDDRARCRPATYRLDT